MNTRTLALAALGAATLSAGAVPAFAADNQEQTSVAVHYRDLDLTTPEGAKELDRRLHLAAQQVCGMDERITGSNLPSHDARECYKHTLKQLQARFATLVGQQKERG
jgi:UrcA family protein